MPRTLGQILKDARLGQGLSLRAVEAQTGIKNAHLSQIENDFISKPEMAMLWELAVLYGLEYEALLKAAGYGRAKETSGRQRQRTTVALRALDDLSPKEQTEVLNFMASLRSKRAHGR
jgi:HTH-type transcriptional regulator, competence development regulator